MATERLSMHKIREILRHKWVLGRSHREVAASLGVSLGAVSAAEQRGREAGLDWLTVESLDDDALATRLYGATVSDRRRALPDPLQLHLELKRPGVTLQLLHHEYLEHHPDGYRYTQFCDHYGRWLKSRRLSMRQIHRAGDKLFVDYSGKKPHLVDPATGECRDVELFVAVLGASNYTFAEATLSQQIGDWIQSHVHAFESIGGATAAVVPDQLRTGISRPCRYEPELQRSYAELARHYGTVILPARPASPRDKAKAEAGVLVAQRWILARLRHQTFFALGAMNQRIGELLIELNDRPMRHYRASRRQLFEQLDRPELKPLPATRYQYALWKFARAGIDYHVELDGHYYSVPYTLRQERFDLRYTSTIVEVFLKGQRVIAHARSYQRGRHTTLPEHMPKSHQAHLEWSPARIARWAATVGTATAALVEAILADRPHPEQGYRSCLGILRLEKRYGPQRLEAACQRAVAVRARSYRHVESILKHGLDRMPAPDQDPQERPALMHANLRGRDYYR